MADDFLKEQSKEYGNQTAESLIDWAFKKLVWFGRRVGWLAVLGVLVMLGGLIDDPERSAEEKKKDRPRALAIGGGLILVSVGLRVWNRYKARGLAGGAPAEEWNMGLRESVRAGVRWLSQRAGGLTVFGAMLALGGGLGLNEGKFLIAREDEQQDYSPEFARGANWGFVLGGLGMIGLQGLLQLRRRPDAPAFVLLDTEASGVYAGDGVRFRRPPEWEVESAPGAEPGVRQFTIDVPGGTVLLEIIPGDVRSKHVNGVIKNLKGKFGASLAFSRSSADVNGQPTLGADFSFPGSKCNHSGQVLAGFRGGQTLALFWQAPDWSEPEVRSGIEMIRASLEWPVADAAPAALVAVPAPAPGRVVNNTWLIVASILAVMVSSVALGFIAESRSGRPGPSGERGQSQNQPPARPTDIRP